MKLSIVYSLAIFLTSSAFALTGGNEGGTAGGNKISRTIASVDTGDAELVLVTDNYAKECLATLGSKLIIDKQDKLYREKVDVEIKRAINEKKNSRSIATDGRQFPECYAYAKDTDNEGIKSLLRKNKPEKVLPEDTRESQGSSR